MIFQKRQVWFRLLTLALAVAAGACLLCDVCTSGSPDWSWIVTVSCGLAWLGAGVGLGSDRVWAGLLGGTAGMFPYLRLLSGLCACPAVWTMGAPLAAVGLLWVWLVYGAIRLRRKRPWLGLAAALWMLVPAGGGAEWILYRYGYGSADLWDLLGYGTVLVLAAAAWGMDRRLG